MFNRGSGTAKLISGTRSACTARYSGSSSFTDGGRITFTNN